MRCAGVAPPVPVWPLGLMPTVLGFRLGVGQPLSTMTVVQAAPEAARSTALALRLTGNRVGRVAAPAAAGPARGRPDGGRRGAVARVGREGPSLRRTSDI